MWFERKGTHLAPGAEIPQPLQLQGEDLAPGESWGPLAFPQPPAPAGACRHDLHKQEITCPGRQQAPKQPETFHGLLVPPQTIPAAPGAHGLCSTPWKAALVIAGLMLPPGEPLSSSPWVQGAALVNAFLTETSYQRHPGMMEQLHASACMCWSQEPCKPTAAFRDTSSTKAAGKFFEGHPSTFLPCLLDHEGRRVCSAAQGSCSTPWASRDTAMEGICHGSLLPPGHPCLLGISALLMEREEGGKLQSARAVSELISAGLSHPCGDCSPGGQC